MRQLVGLIGFSAILLVIAIAVVACKPMHELPFEQSEWLPGGDLTASQISTRSFVEPGKELNTNEKLAFWTGFSLFRDPWVIAPSSTTDRDGLGPLFNTRSCISCHSSGARGAISASSDKQPMALVIKLGLRENESDYGLHVAVESNRHARRAELENISLQQYGEQIQTHAIKYGLKSDQSDNASALVAEAKLSVRYQKVSGAYADGSAYELQLPIYTLSELAHGELEHSVQMSPRLAPAIYGLGLLDAIDEQDLLAQEDEFDANSDGISARYTRAEDKRKIVNNATGNGYNLRRIGRFGLKAKHPSLYQQIAAAFRDDIGITNEMFPDENCAKRQLKCSKVAQLSGEGTVEIPNKLLNLVVQFSQFMAVPPARNLDDNNVQMGRTLFHESKCAHCHTPSYQTRKDYPVSGLANQKIWPYTNLALHDMGELLADEQRTPHANGREWRTPPLWGIGLRQKVQKDARFLHDGRARTIEEAILWHGGEAEQSKQIFINMTKAERSNLLAFLNAI